MAIMVRRDAPLRLQTCLKHLAFFFHVYTSTSEFKTMDIIDLSGMRQIRVASFAAVRMRRIITCHAAKSSCRLMMQQTFSREEERQTNRCCFFFHSQAPA